VIDPETVQAWAPILGFALAAGVVSAGATVAVERFGGRVEIGRASCRERV
jgi:hypothetical protein